MAQEPWSLVQAKRYAEAAEAYSCAYADSGDTCDLRGRANARLLAGQPAEARDDYARVIDETEARYRGSGDYLDLGTSYWYLGEPTSAVAQWRLSTSAPYTDAAGGVGCPVFLLYAGVRLQDTVVESEAVRLLRKLWQKHQRRVERGPAHTTRERHNDLVHPGLYAWPGALVPFLLNKIGVIALDAAAKDTSSDVLRSRQLCQADFAAAVQSLRSGDESGFRVRMAQCASRSRGELEHEFLLARWEVENQFPHRPFAR